MNKSTLTYREFVRLYRFYKNHRCTDLTISQIKTTLILHVSEESSSLATKIANLSEGQMLSLWHSFQKRMVFDEGQRNAEPP